MLRFIRTSRRLVTGLLCLGLMLCRTASAQIQRFDLPAQSLARSLNSIGSLPGLALMYDSALVEGLQAPALHGEWSVDAALELLLAGSGLHARRIKPHAVIVEKNTAAPPAKTLPTPKVSKPIPNLAIPPPQERVEEVIVTGSRLQSADDAVTQVIAHGRAEIERSGAQTMEEFFRWMPEIFGSVASVGIFGAQVNGTGRNAGGDNNTDGAGFDIHGLGAAQTLTLIDGHRVPVAGANGEFVDVSLIPLSAVERIEVLPTGDSAVYGSDAVAGVVNVILRRNYVGAETTVSDSQASHGGNHKWVVSQLLGENWGSGTSLTGGLWLAYEFDHEGGLRANQRGTIPDNYGDGLGTTLLYPEQTFHSLLVKGHQEISDSTRLSGDLIFSQRRYDSINQAPALMQSIDSQGVSRMYGMTLDVTQSLGRQWYLDLSASAYRTDQPASQLEYDSGVRAEFSTVGSRWGLIQIPLVVKGSLCSLPAGDVKTVVGAELRKETEAASEQLSQIGTGNPPFASSKGFSRTIHSVFGELSVPVFDNPFSTVGLRKLELWLAERYDHYSVGGSAGIPAVGLVWSPVKDSIIRASYTQAFVAPRFDQLAQSIPLYHTVEVADPLSPTKQTDTLEEIGGNPELSPERSETYSIGIEQQFSAVPGLSAYSTYFNTIFRSQIARPPYLSQQDLLHDPQLHGFVNLSPNAAQIVQWFNEGQVADTVGSGPAGVQATLDLRFANLAITRESGVDMGATYQHTFSIPTKAIGMSLRGEYLIRDQTQALYTAPIVTLLNQLGEPVNLHLNAVLNASYYRLSGALSVLYVNHYENPLYSPPQPIGSWTTINLHATYDLSNDKVVGMRGFSLSVDFLNLLDRRAPGIQLPANFRNFNPGFDAANADPFGQVITVQLRKCW